MTDPQHAIIEAIPYDRWLSAPEIHASLDHPCFSMPSMRSYVMPLLVNTGVVERRKGKPLRGGYSQFLYRRTGARVPAHLWLESKRAKEHPAAPPPTKRRKCLRCRKTFDSAGRHQHLCKKCEIANLQQPDNHFL